MAVYYVNPYTTVNGTGTWASPYSLDSTNRGSITPNPGDEIRFVAKYLTDILTATAYTATRTAINTITITSGGGLGADFAVGDYIYFPDYDSFVRVNVIATNLLTVGSGNAPLPVSTTALISLNVRKVNLAVATPSGTGSTLLTWGDPAVVALNGVTISDGWVADGVQVTDGTAKSLVRSSTTGASTTWYIDINATQSQNYPPARNSVGNLQNTHYVGPNSAATVVYTYCMALATLNLNQVHAPNGVSASYFSGSTSGTRVAGGLNVTFKHISPSTNIPYAIDSTLNITNLYLTTEFVGFTLWYNGTTNITNLLLASVGGNTLAFSATSSIGPAGTINIGLIDIYGSTGPTTAVTGQLGGYTLNITGPIYRSNRTVTITSIFYRFAVTAPSLGGVAVVNIPLPKINAPGITFSSTSSINALFWNLPGSASGALYNPVNIPAVYQVNAYHASIDRPHWARTAANLLVTYGDGTAPLEILGLNGPSIAPSVSTTAATTVLPIVSLDATTFRTSGPSIRAFLSSYATPGQWGTGWATKTIKIPVVSGSSYTVAGYIRTNQTTFSSGNVVVSVVNRYDVLASQSMTTACINAWEGFSLAFSASQTEELYLAIKMRFSEGNSSIWLDDLTIT